MPQLKTVPSLREQCVHYISSHIDIWCKKNGRSLKLTIDDNPVSRLPNLILNDICTHAMRDKNLRPHHLNSLLNEYTNNLDFSHRVSLSGCKGLFFDHGVALIHNICTNLISLNLSNTEVIAADLAELAESLHSVEYLNLQSTLTNDFVLRNLGNNSPNLRELNVINCFVSDYGINSLCVQNCGLEKFWPGCKCRLIVRLLISNTKVTTRGIKKTIVNLPLMRVIDYDNSLRVFEEIYAEDRLRQFRLENINFKFSDKMSITDKTLVAATSLCPYVIKANFILAINSNVAWLPRIAEFRQLEELSITHGIEKIFFILHYHQIAPTLKLIGSNLKSLTLSNVADVNLCDIGVNCPQLTTLTLDYVSYDSSVIPSATDNSTCIFGELRELSINCNLRDIPTGQLQTLLTNCIHVQILNFSDCQSLTDELLLRVFRCNVFLELHTFKVEYCENVHVTSVLSLITNCNCLKHLTCLRCIGIDISRLVELRALTREKDIHFVVTNNYWQ